jgi:hypothetical protein
MKIEVVLFDNDDRSAAKYASGFIQSGLEIFKVAYLPNGHLIREPGFDALYWTLVGAERYNVRPIEDVIQLVQTTDDDRAAGWPEHLLVGLALSEPNAVDVEAGFRTWARALLAAASSAPAPGIARVKVPTDIVRLSELTPGRAAAILAEAEREHINDRR